MTRAEALLDLARSRRAVIATAESCTAGLLAAAITEPAGASDIFDRGFVTYSNAAKTELLGVADELLAAHGAVSEPVAIGMAEGALARSDAWIAVAITGVAGPGSSDAKPEGRVCFAVARRGGGTLSETVEFGALGRHEVRSRSTDHALGLLIQVLEGDAASA